MQKHTLHLKESERKIFLADHLTYKIYPLMKEKTILLKILSELHESTLHLIKSILIYEQLYKNITITENAQTNLQIFARKCAPRYSITPEEIKLIMQLIDIHKKHSQSPMEFTRGEKIVILSDLNTELKTETIDIERIKLFLNNNKNIIHKTKSKINYC